uniref:THAP domain-containing protein 9 n=1 Tax=Schizaphis graminum TaxID=13262 RepID=A0A2S2PCA9_SCHGA
MYKVSAYVENVTHYIAGFVAKTVSQKINCLICKQVLSINHTTNLLITLKDRNNALFKPSKDVEYICSVEIKSEVCRTVFLSKDMDAHLHGQGLFTNHRDQLLTLIITAYINLRLKH